MEELKIDSHKLLYHPERVYRWLNKEDIYPLYVEISPSGTCNHRCIFCAFDYLNYRKNFIKTDVLKKTLKDMAEKGVKAVMYSGEGEPFLHKDIVDLILYTKRVGIDVAIAINGVFFTPEVARKCLKVLTWMKVSINGGRRETYARVHRCKEEDFDKVINNLKEAVKIKRENGYLSTIGAQTVVLLENIKDIKTLAMGLRDIGLEYLVIKPFVKHPLSSCEIKEITDDELLELEDKLKGISDEEFKIYFRRHSFIKLKEKRPYQRCLGLPFFCEITSNGNIYTCGPYLGKEEFCYGNIYKNSFEEIWKGERRKKILEMIAKLDTQTCMKNCRLDEINRYLWELKHPSLHVNFI